MDCFVAAHPDCVSARKAPWSERGPDTIVIHTMEGSFKGSVGWATYSRRQRAESFLRRRQDKTLEELLISPLTFPTAAHYYFSQLGDCTQMVHDSLKSAHANSYNSRSIGFEHEGHAAKGGFSDAMLLKSAACAAALCRKYGIVPSRKTIVGHFEVPGASHTDPGPHWPWARYMAMVGEAYVKLPARAP